MKTSCGVTWLSLALGLSLALPAVAIIEASNANINDNALQTAYQVSEKERFSSRSYSNFNGIADQATVSSPSPFAQSDARSTGHGKRRPRALEKSVPVEERRWKSRNKNLASRQLGDGSQKSSARRNLRTTERFYFMKSLWYSFDSKTREELTTRFEAFLEKLKQIHAKQIESKAEALVSNAGTGGIVLSVSAVPDAENECIETPPLTITSVTDLARKSFDQKDFNPEVPECETGMFKHSDVYGKCCERSQVSYFEKAFDTAVATMALGATKDEAFAPFLHARALARTLNVCNPSLVEKRSASFRRRVWTTLESQTLGPWETRDIFFVAFPRSYELLYELYNAMLIERVRLRQAPKYPSPAAMQQFLYSVENQRNAAVYASIELEIDAHESLPSKPDWHQFFTHKLSQHFSARIAASHSEIKFAIRESQLAGHVFELVTASDQVVDDKMCSKHIPPTQYFPFAVEPVVKSKFQACCAAECNFLAMYGRIFTQSAANCCLGCNRYMCRSNTIYTATILSQLSRITTPQKDDYTPMLLSLIV